MAKYASALNSASIDATGKLKDTPANRALHPSVLSDELFHQLKKLPEAYYSDSNSIVFNGDARAIFKKLAELDASANCMVTSPPYYGQRDYGVPEAIGLEPHPSEFISRLTEIFSAANPVLNEHGSLWINIGDTYWSGKGAAVGKDSKQSARRFGKRPQDFPGDGHWARPKQLLLIPHRMAIALQDDDWLVRNDNIWVKEHPVPDFVRDRSSTSHEHVFHFTKSRWYFYDKSSVGTTTSTGRIAPPRDTWLVATSRGGSAHKASYSEELVRIPILATTPKNGVVLDPFNGTGTTMLFAKNHGFRSIGIDISEEYCEIAAQRLAEAEGALNGTLF